MTRPTPNPDAGSESLASSANSPDSSAPGTDAGTPRRRPKPADVVAIGLATAGGAGFSPTAPGTVGTLVAIPVFVAVAQVGPWLQATPQ